MRQNAADVPAGTTLDADVAIVGAGPAGLTVALELAARGIRVCLLESGGPGRAQAAQHLAEGDSVGNPHYPLDEARVRAFGGTSNHWHDFGWFRARPLEPQDFEERPGIPHSGWPLSRAELDPFYERAQAWCALGRYDYSTAPYVTDERQELPWVGGPLTTSIFKLSPPETWRNRIDDVSQHDAIQLLLHATVTSIETASATSVASLQVVGDARNAFTVRAKRYVIATGGMENPRLLLLSRSDHHPTGLGNRHDVVGRYFMEHPRIRVATLEPSDPELVHHTTLYDTHFGDEDGVRIHAKLGVRPEVLNERGLLHSVFFVQGLTRARGDLAIRSGVALRNAMVWNPKPPHLGKHIGRVLQGTPALAATAYQEVKRRIQHRPPAPEVLQLEAMAEQVPNPESRIVLGPERDALGQPKGRLDWRTTPLDLRSLREAAIMVDEQMRAGGHGRALWRVGDREPVEPFKGGWHHIGTTRMHTDPTLGVVDADLRVHGMDDVYIAGSSVFPTGGYANPTLTIVALSVRLADHLADQLT